MADENLTTAPGKRPTLSVSGLPSDLSGWNSYYNYVAGVYKLDAYNMYPWMWGGYPVKSARIIKEANGWIFQVLEEPRDPRQSSPRWKTAGKKVEDTPDPAGFWFYNYEGKKCSFHVSTYST